MAVVETWMEVRRLAFPADHMVIHQYWWRTSQRWTITFETEVKLLAGSLLAKIVGCYIPCPLNLYGNIGYNHARKDASVTSVIVDGWMRHGPLRPRPFGCLLRRFSWWRRHHGRENFTLKTLDSDKIIVGSPNLVMSARGPEREPPRAIRVTQTWRTKWPV